MTWEGRFVCMPKVVVKENEQLDDALRRFKRQVSRNGTLAEARKREFYVKPGNLKLHAKPVEENKKIICICRFFCLKGLLWKPRL